MALVVKDRVKETTTTTGTGALSLAGAVTNFIAFSAALSDGDTTYYAIVDNTNDDFEVGLGTYASAGNTLTRTTVLASSNAGSAVNLSAGTKDVFVTYPADKSVYLDSSGNIASVTITSANINGGNINGTLVGGLTPAAGSFTTFTSTGIDDNATSTAITIDSSERVGVGETSPSRKLQVTSAQSIVGTIKSTLANFPATLTFRDAGETIAEGVRIGAEDDSLLLQTNGTTRLSIDSSGSVAITSADINGGTIDGTTIGGTTAAAGTFTALTSNGIDDNATSTAITIDASENVGIGVTSLTHKLQLPQVSGTSLSFSNDASFTLDGESVAYYGLTYSAPTGKFNMVLSAFSDLVFATNATERMRIDSSGSVAITSADINGGTIDGTTIGGTTPDKGTFVGASAYDAGVVVRSGGSTTASWSRLNITNQNDTGGGVGIIYMDGAGTFAFRNDTGTNQIMSFLFGSAEEFRMTSAGDFHADGDVIAYSTTISDASLKDDVETIDSALDKVSNLRGVTYTWNAGSREGKRDLGVIAQEVEAVIPEIVHEHEMPLLDGETYKTVDYEKLTAVLIEAVKELKAEVEALKNGASI